MYSNRGAIALSEAINDCDKLKYLKMDLSNAGIGDYGAKIFCTNLASCSQLKLVELVLQGNRFSERLGAGYFYKNFKKIKLYLDLWGEERV